MLRNAKLALLPVLAAALLVVAGVWLHAAPQPHAHFEPDSSLMVSTRDHLRVCLDTHGAVDAGQASRHVSTALGAVRQHRQWDMTQYGTDVPELERGCPTTLPAGVLARGTVIGPGLTAEPGPFRVVVVVLDDATADRHLADQPAALVRYEMMRVNDRDSVVVTQAVAVRADFVHSPAFVTDYLMWALGLNPANR